MASIHKDILLDAEPADVRAGIGEAGAAHVRLVLGVLVDARLGWRGQDRRASVHEAVPAALVEPRVAGRPVPCHPRLGCQS